MMFLAQPHEIMWMSFLCCYCVFTNTLSTLNGPIRVGEISMEIIRVGDTNFLVKVELVWV